MNIDITTNLHIDRSHEALELDHRPIAKRWRCTQPPIVSHMCRDSFVCVPWRIHMCAMTQSHVYYDPVICVPWLSWMCAMTHSLELDHRHIAKRWRCKATYCIIYVLWLIRMCAVTHSYVCHDRGICVPRLSYMCAVTHSSVWRVQWLIHMCDQIRSVNDWISSANT